MPVVLTQGIGDYSALVPSNGVGCVLPDSGLSKESRDTVVAFLDTCPMDATELNAKCHALAVRELSAERARDSIEALYRVLSSESLDDRGRWTSRITPSLSSETAA